MVLNCLLQFLRSTTLLNTCTSSVTLSTTELEEQWQFCNCTVKHRLATKHSCVPFHVVLALVWLLLQWMAFSACHFYWTLCSVTVCMCYCVHVIFTGAAAEMMVLHHPWCSVVCEMAFFFFFFNIAHWWLFKEGKTCYNKPSNLVAIDCLYVSVYCMYVYHKGCFTLRLLIKCLHNGVRCVVRLCSYC
jgi:hypothetical protein